MRNLDSILRAKLDDLQFASGGPAVIIDQLPIGYGGQLSRRLLGLKIGLAVDRKALFASDADYPYVQTIRRPFSGAPDSSMEAEQFSPDNLLSPAVVLSFDYFRVQKLLKLRNLSVEKWVESELTKKFELSEEELARMDGWLLSWLQFLPEFEERVSGDMARLGLTSDTLGVHLRRGDKKVETPYVPASLINSTIVEIFRSWPFRTIFVASDDPAAASLIAAPQGTKIIFDASEKRYNNANHKMLMASPSIAAEETYVAFKNLRLLAACGGIVGQDNAHFATIAASHILYRGGHPERIALLRGNIAMDQSRGTHLYYSFKTKIREMAKIALPSPVVRLITRLTN